MEDLKKGSGIDNKIKAGCFLLLATLCGIMLLLNPGLRCEAKGGETKVKITIIYDNYEHAKGLRTGWGFSCMVEGLEKTVLFDTGGDGRLLLDNMKKLNLDPGAVDVVFLSHNHFDHTGGLEAFLMQNSQVQVVLPDSFPPGFKEGVRGFGAEVLEIKGSQEIFKDVLSTGEMGSFIEEQSMVIITEKGSVVITGCAHPGIVNIVDKANRISGKNSRLVLGGFHLGGTSESNLLDIIDDLKKLGAEKVAPCHCSGDRTRKVFERELGDAYLEVGVGKVISLD
jgi:7,8-dihydropterin-6-yl-methyl-4-(beta-D-ribofuranosyl)aminobenzene 5'-phosphate synthase